MLSHLQNLLFLFIFLAQNTKSEDWRSFCLSESTLYKRFSTITRSAQIILTESGNLDAGQVTLLQNSFNPNDQNVYSLYTKLTKKQDFPRVMQYLTTYMSLKSREILPYFVNCFVGQAFLSKKESILQEYVQPMEFYIENRRPSLKLFSGKIREAFQSLEVIFRNGFFYKMLDQSQIGVSSFLMERRDVIFNTEIYAQNEMSNRFYRGRLNLAGENASSFDKGSFHNQFENELSDNFSGLKRKKAGLRNIDSAELSLLDSQKDEASFSSQGEDSKSIVSKQIDAIERKFSSPEPAQSMCLDSINRVIPLSFTKSPERQKTEERVSKPDLIKDKRSVEVEDTFSNPMFEPYRGKVRFLNRLGVHCAANKLPSLTAYFKNFKHARHIYGKAAHLPKYDFQFCVKSNVYFFVKSIETYFQKLGNKGFGFFRILTEIEKTLLLFEYQLHDDTNSVDTLLSDSKAAPEDLFLDSVYKLYPLKALSVPGVVLDYLTKSINSSRTIFCDRRIIEFFLQHHFYRHFLLELLSAFHLMRAKFLRRSLLLLLTDLQAFLLGRPLIINSRATFLKTEVNRFVYYGYEKKFKTITSQKIYDPKLKYKFEQIKGIIQEKFGKNMGDWTIEKLLSQKGPYYRNNTEQLKKKSSSFDTVSSSTNFKNSFENHSQSDYGMINTIHSEMGTPLSPIRIQPSADSHDKGYHDMLDVKPLLFERTYDRLVPSNYYESESLGNGVSILGSDSLMSKSSDLGLNKKVFGKGLKFHKSFRILV